MQRRMNPKHRATSGLDATSQHLPINWGFGTKAASFGHCGHHSTSLVTYSLYFKHLFCFKLVNLCMLAAL